MAITILTVIVLILIAGYAAFFAVWNPDVLEIIALRYPGGDLLQSAPVWTLPLAGLLIGAILMASALSGPWSTMRRAAMLAQQQLRAERDKGNKRAKKVNALSKRVKELEGSAGGSADEDESAEEGLE